MNIELILERIESLAEAMINEQQGENARAISFATIRTLAAELEEISESSDVPSLYIEEKISELVWHAASIAHLDNGNGHTDDAHFVWLLGVLSGLGSPCTFGPVIERQRQESGTTQREE
jgi:hypothetical protein